MKQHQIASSHNTTRVRSTLGSIARLSPRIRHFSHGWLRSRAAYSPYEGWELAGWPVITILRGQIAYRGHETVGLPRGEALLFEF